MTTKNKMYSRPEGCICEQFAYHPKRDVYPNNSDMKELAEIPHAALSL